MRYYVYLIGFIVSIILAVVGGIGFRFLEVDNERRAAAEAYRQLQELLGESHIVRISLGHCLFSSLFMRRSVCLLVC